MIDEQLPHGFMARGTVAAGIMHWGVPTLFIREVDVCTVVDGFDDVFNVSILACSQQV